MSTTISDPTPTPYPDVNIVLHRLLSDVQTILRDRFVGLYLYGSLSSGDFDPERSDIDFVVVTTEDLPGEIVSALGEMHTRFLSSGLKWAKKLEGSYISRQAIRRYDPNAAPCPTLNEEKFYVGSHGSDWIIQRSIIRTGVTLAGPPPQTLIDPVSPDDVRGAVLGILRGWWLSFLTDRERDSWLDREEYKAFAVLTMCRALYTLEFCSVASKPVSARWAKQALGERWISLIDRSLLWQHGAQTITLDETLAFMRFSLERCHLLD